MNELNKFSQIILNVLDIIEYPQNERSQFVIDFLGIVEAKSVERFQNRLSLRGKTALQQIYSNSARITTQQQILNRNSEIQRILLSEISIKEISIIYFECLKDLFEDWMKAIKDTLSAQQLESLQVLLEREISSLQENHGV